MHESHHTSPHKILIDWIAQESISFSPVSSESRHAAIDRIISSPDNRVELLAFGEPLHGSEEILTLRNHLFQYLVEKYGFRAIAIESSFSRSRIVHEYISGSGPDSYETIQDAGFSHGFGCFSANRDLVEWMRQDNTDPSHAVKLRFYGFDGPMEMMTTESPRELLFFALDFLTSVDPKTGQGYRERIRPLLPEDPLWENQEAMMDPGKSVGLTPAATALRIETEELITELWVRRPELVASSDEPRYLEAMQYAGMARELLTYHAGVARNSRDRTSRLLGIRDAMMADILAYIVSVEHDRGKVLAFAHNSHLKYGKSEWQLGPHLCTWWPAGSHLHHLLGSRYAVIGTGIGVMESQGIERPEPGTLEDLLLARPDSGLIIPTHPVQGNVPAPIEGLPVRSASQKNSTYFPFTPQSLTDFDWLMILNY